METAVLERIRLAPTIGFELRGIDLSRPINGETRAGIWDAWIEGGILLIRDETMTDEQHLALSRVFGDLEPSATRSLNDRDNPYFLTLEYDPDNPRHRARQHFRVDGTVRAGWIGWHWDQAFMPQIVRGAALRMIRPADELGETGFADGIAAHERLPARLKQRIEGLEVVYQFDYFGTRQFGFPTDIEAVPGNTDWVPGGFPPVVHPLVIVQPETGRKVLKLSPMHSRHVLGMERAESDELLAELAHCLTDPAHAYFHKWRRNDVIIWDNWRVIHCATGTPLDCARKAVRTTIAGDYEAGRLLDPAACGPPPAKFLD